MRDVHLINRWQRGGLEMFIGGRECVRFWPKADAPQGSHLYVSESVGFRPMAHIVAVKPNPIPLETCLALGAGNGGRRGLTVHEMIG